MFLRIVFALCLFIGSLQAHWFNVSPEVTDEALKALSKIHKFGENSSLSIHPMTNGKAIAIYHGKNPEWFNFSKGYYCYLYDGKQWGQPCKINDFNDELFHLSQVITKFICNEKDEAYFLFKDKDSIQVCELTQKTWIPAVSISLPKSSMALQIKKFFKSSYTIDLSFQIDLCGTLLVKTEDDKIFYIKDQKVTVEELTNLVNSSNLIKDCQGNLCYLALVDDVESGNCLIEECTWDGFQWNKIVLLTVKKSFLGSLNYKHPYLFTFNLQSFQTQKLAIWNLKYADETQKNIYFSSKNVDVWSYPEIIDKNNSNFVLCEFKDNPMCVSHSTTKIWRNGYWEDLPSMDIKDINMSSDVPMHIKCNSKGQACFLWKTTDEGMNKKFYACIWDGNVWSKPQEIFQRSFFQRPVLDNKDFEFDIDDQGNVLVVWDEKPYPAGSGMIYYRTYSNNQWNNIESIKNHIIPHLFNFKGNIILSGVSNYSADTFFCFYKNGNFSKHFYSTTQQDIINYYLNLID